MANSLTIKAEIRDKLGSNYSRKLRKNGKLPAVLYGSGEANIPLAIPVEEFQKAIRYKIRQIDLETNGKVEKTVIKDIQWDPFSIEVLHVDFTRASEEQLAAVAGTSETSKTEAPGDTPETEPPAETSE